MAKYTCPVCGKIWYNVNDLADCVAADAKAENNKQLIEKQRIEDKDKLAALRKEVDTAYATLKNKVTAYNTAAQKYNAAYVDKAAILDCSYTSKVQRTKPIPENPWLNITEDGDLNDIIRSAFGY